jgi:hypothetical protein
MPISHCHPTTENGTEPSVDEKLRESKTEVKPEMSAPPRLTIKPLLSGDEFRDLKQRLRKISDDD